MVIPLDTRGRILDGEHEAGWYVRVAQTEDGVYVFTSQDPDFSTGYDQWFETVQGAARYMHDMRWRIAWEDAPMTTEPVPSVQPPPPGPRAVAVTLRGEGDKLELLRRARTFTGWTLAEVQGVVGPITADHEVTVHARDARAAERLVAAATGLGYEARLP